MELHIRLCTEMSRVHSSGSQRLGSTAALGAALKSQGLRVAHCNLLPYPPCRKMLLDGRAGSGRRLPLFPAYLVRLEG